MRASQFLLFLETLLILLVISLSTSIPSGSSRFFVATCPSLLVPLLQLLVTRLPAQTWTIQK
jgi:hypothetical protein